MPGHTPGLLCLYDREHRLFLSDDHLLEHVSPNPLIELGPDGQEDWRPLVAYLESVGRLHALDVDTDPARPLHAVRRPPRGDRPAARLLREAAAEDPRRAPEGPAHRLGGHAAPLPARAGRGHVPHRLGDARQPGGPGGRGARWCGRTTGMSSGSVCGKNSRMLAIWTQPETWISLATLAAMEIVLGVDNIVFLTILAGKLPAAQQPLARRLGLGAALGTRLVLLFAITWLMGLTADLFMLVGARGSPAATSSWGWAASSSSARPPSRSTTSSRPATRRTAPGGRQGLLRLDHPPDRAPRHRLLARLGDHRGGHGPAHRGDGGGHGGGGGGDAGLRRPHREVRRGPPHREDAGALLPHPHRGDAGGRVARPAHPARLRLLRHGLLARRWRC